MFQKKNVMRYVSKTLMPALILVLAVVVSMLPFGCRSSVEGIDFLQGDFSVPEIMNVQVTDPYSICLDFSKPVHVNLACISEKAEDEGEAGSSRGDAVQVQALLEDDGCKVSFVTEEKTKIGQKYILDAELEDESGNTLTVQVEFKGFNDRIPSLVMSELRMKKKSKKAGPEFVEFYALSSGNTSGISLVSGANGIENRYEFPAMEVKAGEYIVLHLRNDCEGSVDETGTSLALAKAPDCVNTARDLFVPRGDKDKRFLGIGSDVIYLQNVNTGVLYDAIVIVDKTKNPEKMPESLLEAAALVEQSGLWLDSEENPSCTLESAVNGSSIDKDAHSLNRRSVKSLKSNSHPAKAGMWYEVSKTKEQTPGLPNL
ncbi:MAG: hypothetical protein J6Y69_04625 [Treponema sp.]|nr:hypothetical protein [Treponema sp.]